MSQPAPLGAPTLAALTTLAAETYGDRPALRYKRDGEWQDLSYAGLAKAVEELAIGLMDLGVEPGDHVGLFAETRPEWTQADLAIASTGAASVPVYPTSTEEECAWVLGDAGVRIVVCGDQAQAAKIAAVRDQLPALERVVLIDPEGDRLTLGVLRSFGRVAGAEGRAELRKRVAGVTAADLSTIVYTSGTTGPPKGCKLSHGNWRAALDAVSPHLATSSEIAGEGDVTFLYLPLAHLLSRIVQITTFEHGATLAYYGGDIKHVVSELTEVRPTHLPSVPRLFEKVYAQVSALAADDPERLRRAIELGVDVRGRRERGEPVSEDEQRRFDEAEERLYGLVRAAFGGRVRQAITGGAPIAPEILEFFFACGIPVYEGYGMTESTALISLNSPLGVRIGTVGRPLDGIEVRIAGDGEVMTRGAHVFGGYHANASATGEALAEDWLRTGDLGQLDADGYLRITGRKKDIIITAAGKNLTPANIENDLRQCRWIAEAVMHGDRQPYPVGLITLDAEEILPWAAERGLPGDVAVLATHPEVRKLIASEVDRANAKYAPPARIRRFAILGHDLTIEAGELTPTLKVRRAVVSERYADVLDALYN